MGGGIQTPPPLYAEGLNHCPWEMNNIPFTTGSTGLEKNELKFLTWRKKIHSRIIEH